MKKYLLHKRLYIGVIIVIAILFILPGCSEQNAEGFAIYLTKNDIPPSQTLRQSRRYLSMILSPIMPKPTKLN